MGRCEPLARRRRVFHPARKEMNVMETVILEIRAAEGGADAKLLVGEQYRVYEKFMALEKL